MSPPEIPSEAFAALAEKYARLLSLRERGERGDELPRAELRDLAASFPGALKELDTTPTETLISLEEQARSAARGATPSPKLRWFACFHQLLGWLLAHKRKTRGHAPENLRPPAGWLHLTDADRDALLALVSERRRPTAAAIGLIARWEAVPPETIADTLFPHRTRFVRPRPPL